MEREDHSQLELFSQEGSESQVRVPAGHSSFLRRIRAYEKSILMIICFVITAIISFSLGVEKGRKLASVDSFSERASLPVQKQQTTVIEENNQDSAADKKPLLYGDTATIVKKEQVGFKGRSSGYTIQLASYKTMAYAQKEGEFLKKKGLLPVFLTKGNYTVLCIGNFSSRDAAGSLLSELKKQKRYSGCLIRRL